MGRTLSWTVLGFSALLCTVSASGAAQELAPKRWELGIDLTGVVPVGEFQRFIEAGGGINAFLVHYPGRGRHIGLRVDGAGALYGHERFSVPLLQSTGRIVVDVTTDNMIFGLGAGPQLTFLNGRFRPYVYGTVGFSYFVTTSSVGGSANVDDFANTVNFDDITAAATTGTGFAWRVSSGNNPISLSAAGQFVYNGTADYLTEGSIVDNPDGSSTITPIRSKANYVAIRLGITIGL